MNNLNNGLSEFSGNNVIDDLTHINSSKDLPHKENDEKELDDRNKIYSTILENYSKYLKDTLNSNKSNKQIFLIGLLVILLIIVIGFFILSLINSSGFVPVILSAAAKMISTQFEIIALAAIGMRVKFADLMKEGPKAMLYGCLTGTSQVILALIFIALLLG